MSRRFCASGRQHRAAVWRQRHEKSSPWLVRHAKRMTGGTALPGGVCYGRRSDSRRRAQILSGKADVRVDEVPGRIVVDASLALKWVLEEEHSDQASVLGRGREMLTSALFWAEAGNAIATRIRRGELDRLRGNDALRDLRAAPLVPSRSTPTLPWLRWQLRMISRIRSTTAVTWLWRLTKMLLW